MTRSDDVSHVTIPARLAVEECVDGGECLVYCASRDEASVLNRTAREVWMLCDGTHDVAAIGRELARRYGVPPGWLIDEVRMVIRQLHARALIELQTKSAP